MIPICRLIFALRRTVGFDPCKVVYTAGPTIQIAELFLPVMQKHQLVRVGISTRIAAVERFDVLDRLAARVIAHAFQKQYKVSLFESE